MTPTRLVVGFVAGFLSVLTFQSGLIALFYAAGAVPFAPWRMTPVPPFGVPQSLSAAFWGGLWGIAYALLEPRLTARLGSWLGCCGSWCCRSRASRSAAGSPRRRGCC